MPIKSRLLRDAAPGLALMVFCLAPLALAFKLPRFSRAPAIEWLPSETASVSHPAWIVAGAFILADGRRSYIPDRLIVGVAPGGDVAVWVAGPGGTVEVGLWQGQPIELSMVEMIGEADLTHEAFVEMLLSENLSDEARDTLATVGAQPGLRRARAQRFFWSPEVAEGSGQAFYLASLNGEILWLPANPVAALRAALERLHFYWQRPAGARVAVMVFDPVESLAAFQRLSPERPDQA